MLRTINSTIQICSDGNKGQIYSLNHIFFLFLLKAKHLSHRLTKKTGKNDINGIPRDRQE